MIFTDFKSNAKVWMYVSSQSIDTLTQKKISDQFLNFAETWKSHGEKVSGKLTFINDYVIVVGADLLVDSMCGRAVDSQVRFIKDLEQETGFTFMNRQNVCLNNKDHLYVVAFSDLKQLVECGDVDENTLIYNSMIQSNNEDIICPISHSPFGNVIFS